MNVPRASKRAQACRPPVALNVVCLRRRRLGRERITFVEKVAGSLSGLRRFIPASIASLPQPPQLEEVNTWRESFDASKPLGLARAASTMFPSVARLEVTQVVMSKRC